MPFVSWVDEDALNKHLIRMYGSIAKDVGNQVEHLTIWNYLTADNELLGQNIQIICKPDLTEQLAEAWGTLNPTIYTADHMAGRRKAHYILLPPPERLGVAPWGGADGNLCGLLVQESRKVLAVHF